MVCNQLTATADQKDNYIMHYPKCPHVPTESSVSSTPVVTTTPTVL